MNIPVCCRAVLLFWLAIARVPGFTSGAEPSIVRAPEGMVESALGVTRQGTAISCWLDRDDFDYHTTKTRILLVGGLDGDARSADAVRKAVIGFRTGDAMRRWRERFAMSAVPAALPDRIAGPQPDSASRESMPAFPPPQNASYQSPTAPEAAYLWRWIGMHAPDLVVDVRSGESLTWFAPDASHRGWASLARRLQARPGSAASDELAEQLNRVAPCETGLVPALRVVTRDEAFVSTLLEALEQTGFTGPSPARRELQSRLGRTPQQVATQLSRHYGHALDQVVYIPAMALIGRLRLGELAGDASHRTDVERIVAPYVDGTRKANADNGSALSGHLIFCELADRSDGQRRARYVELARVAADQAFDQNGQPLPSMPYHLEMSDSLFMGGPILAHVGSLTGESRYYDACVRHLRFMRQLCLRPDGLYRHSPLDDAAWGRGNGFPALGVSLSLAALPAGHPARTELLEWLRSHLRALLAHQDPTGCWHQVIDRRESYRELTATCMIGLTMSRGVREGWLDRAEFQPAIEKAWYAIRTRVAPNGRLVDVCTGTGKQKSLRDYYDRPAILGLDDRGGAMALLAAVELAR
jgi:unsaturated rhamnogalacturonyl hydrolase